MLTLEEIRIKMQDRNVTKVAERIGVTRVHLSTILNNTKSNPSYRIVKSLSDYLES